MGLPGAARRVLLALALLLAPAPTPAAERVIVALGDSLTAGFGVAADEAYPALVSGDTSAGGLRRLDWVLRSRPEIVIVALGANDGLRGLPIAALRDNLTAIVTRLRADGVRVLLVGMRLPPNYGKAYASEFTEAFRDVARRTSSTYLPFLLEGVAGDPSLNQPDGIHPNASGQRAVAERVWASLEPLLRR